jgi:Amt family ammonium transporter
VGGILGSLLVAVLASSALGGAGYAPGMTMARQIGAQVLGVAAVCAWSAIASLALALICRAVVGLRVGDEEAEEGLDMASHGERAYNI